MFLRYLLSTLLILSSFSPYNFAAATGANKSYRIQAERLYATDFIAEKYAKVKNNKDFLKAFGEHLKPADKKYLSDLSKNEPWPKIQRKGDTIHFGDQLRIKYINPSLNKVEINGIEFTLDPSLPLKMQTELIVRKLNQQKSNALFNLLIPQAEAFIPFAAIVAGAVVALQVGARVVVGAAGRVFASKPALVVGGMVAAPVVNTSAARLTNAAGDQIAAVVCMIGQHCEKEDGTVVQPEIIDAPQSGIDLLIKIEKCPDINDRTFKMNTRLPSGQSVTYTVETEEVEGKARIKKIHEVHNSPGVRPYPPINYTFDEQGLKVVNWETQIITGDGQTHKTPSILDRDFSKEGSADNTAENREKWESFRLVTSFVNQSMALYCRKEVISTVQENKTQPQPIIVPQGQGSGSAVSQ